MLLNPYRFGGAATTLTWSPTNKNAAVILLNGDTEATKPNAGFVSVRSDVGHSSGVKQFELTWSAGQSNVWGGVVNQDYAGYADIIGDSTNTSGCGAVSYRMSNANWTEHLESNVNNFAAHGNPISITDVLGVVVDFTDHQIRFYKNGVLVVTRSLFTTLNGTKVWYPAASVQNGSQIKIIGNSFAYPIAGATSWV
ncbi:SPRY domain protein [compost metagenome]